jgi:small-conductance mechanosensitive channel
MPSVPSIRNLFGQVLPEPWSTLVGTPLSIAVTVVLAVVARWLSHRFIDRMLSNAHSRHDGRLKALRTVGGRAIVDVTGYASARHQQRMATTASVLKSMLTIVILGSALLMVLDLLGLPLAPLLASAGVGGLAIGFGAQSLVKDFFSGIFMIAEDQYGVGDVIDTGAVVGTVEEVSLRITRIRDAEGVVWYLRNGEILRVGNRSQGWSVAVVDVQVGYDEDVATVSGVIDGAVAGLDGEEPWSGVLMEQPKVTGIESMAGGAITLRVSARVRANERDGVQRELRRRVKAALDRHDIRLATVALPPGPAAAGAGGGGQAGSPTPSAAPAPPAL